MIKERKSESQSEVIEQLIALEKNGLGKVLTINQGLKSGEHGSTLLEGVNLR
ncbi:hypothetical protein [Formosa algae]|uniref:CopG family antitoxin n=1 Tax=Formosa algae TaxID=225843 RepID=A0A9X0YNG3_9FLAO|nr:hypothetical protein [Formosa algae]MBP1840584.1 putative CopG family antitoxin [Formosa algae]MDQ0336003.1 putative CopG family antitoxin [Formosa algae]